MPNLKHIYVLLSLVLMVLPLEGRITQKMFDKMICDTKCHCFRDTVECNGQDKINYLPSRLNNSRFKILSVTQANFVVHRLSQHNFTHLTELTRLIIIYSRLEYIENDTFAYMDNLQLLDLSSNNFSRIEPRAFTSLRLTTFFLERNTPALVIKKDMFKNSVIGNVSLMHNGIKNLPYDAFRSAKINILDLYNNSIVTIDKRFIKLFSSEERRINLSQNPLYCGCEFKWFKQMMATWKLNQEIGIKCYNPIEFRGRLLSSLSYSDLTCKVPPINKITIDINPTNIQMSCHSNINELRNKNSNWYSNRASNKSPWLTWKQYDKTMQNEISHIEKFERTGTRAFVSLNITNIQTTNSFICQTNNEFNMSNKVIVNLKMARDYLKQFYSRIKNKNPVLNKDNGNRRKTTSFINYEQPNSISTNIENGHFLFRKRFSILQMIGAVVGTFTLVVVLIIVVHFSRDHVIKKRTGLHTYVGQFNNANPRLSMLPMNQSNGAVYNSYVTGIKNNVVAGSNANEYQKYYNSSNDLMSYKAMNKDNIVKSSGNFNVQNPQTNANNNNNKPAVNLMTGSTHSYVYDDANNLNNNSSSNTLKSNNNRNNTTKSSTSTSTSSTCNNNENNLSILPQPPTHPPPPLPSTTNNLIPIIQPTTSGSLYYPLSTHQTPTTSATPVIIATSNNDQYLQPQQQHPHIFNYNSQQNTPFITS